ncbi:MAG TPA: hypothetical protein VE033_11195 [Acetobacteraceae bacterium]|nr:hypothetical protein [Acetobacteraceae bacterium]
MATSRRPSQSWALVDLEEGRVDTAAAFGGKLLEAAMPDGAEGTAEMVKAGLLGLNALPRVGALAKGTARALAWPMEHLARAKRPDLSIGDTVCIRQAARFDWIEVLMAAQGELGRDDLRLVPPGITFAEACHGYCWPGLS